MLYSDFKPVLHSPCFHYLITHSNEDTTENNLLSFDEIRTLIYIMLARRKDGISIEELKQLYMIIDIQYHSHSAVAKGSNFYFDVDISTNNCLDVNKLIAAIEKRTEQFRPKYTTLKCSDFYKKLSKVRDICICCPFYRGKKNNYALDEKYNLLCYMLRKHDNFDRIVGYANDNFINMTELLNYNYDVRICGAVPLDVSMPLLIPFFQVMYEVCSENSISTLNRYSDKALDFNPNVTLEEDILFIRLLNYLVSESFPYHKVWEQEFEYIFKIKERPFDFKKLLSDFSNRNTATVRWLEGMYKEVFNGVTHNTDFSYQDCLNTIIISSKGKVFVDKESAVKWSQEHKNSTSPKSDLVSFDYFGQNMFSGNTSIFSNQLSFGSVTVETAESANETISADNAGGSFMSDDTLNAAEHVSITEGEVQAEFPDNIAEENVSEEVPEKPGVSTLLADGVHPTVEDVLAGRLSIEDVNEYHLNKPYASDLEEDIIFVDLYHMENAPSLNDFFGDETGNNSYNNRPVREVNEEVNEKVNENLETVDIIDNINNSYKAINPPINPVINPNTTTSADETYLLSDKEIFYDHTPYESEDKPSGTDAIQYSKMLFDRYIQYQRINSAISPTRLVYYSPAELLCSYPLDITMVAGKTNKPENPFKIKQHLGNPLISKKIQTTALALPDLSNENKASDRNVFTIMTFHEQKQDKKCAFYDKLTPKEREVLDYLHSSPVTKIPRNTFVSFTDAYYTQFDFTKLAELNPYSIISFSKFRKYARNLNNADCLQQFETALIKDHALCVEAVESNAGIDYLVFYVNSSAITGNNVRSCWYYLNMTDMEVVSVINSYMKRNSYIKICYSSHRLYAVLKKYNMEFRNIFAISSAIGVLASSNMSIPYKSFYRHIFNRHLFDNKELPDIVCMMRKNVTLYRCLSSLLSAPEHAEVWKRQQYIDVALGCSYLPHNIFPVSKCSLYRVIDYNTYYMNTYNGRNSLMAGSFIRYSVAKNLLNSLEDYALVPAVLIALAYKGIFRKYHIYVTEYSSYSCCVFVEEKAVDYIYSLIISEASNRIKEMYPERIRNVTLLHVNCSPANVVS